MPINLNWVLYQKTRSCYVNYPSCFASHNTKLKIRVKKHSAICIFCSSPYINTQSSYLNYRSYFVPHYTKPKIRAQKSILFVFLDWDINCRHVPVTWIVQDILCHWVYYHSLSPVHPSLSVSLPPSPSLLHPSTLSPDQPVLHIKTIHLLPPLHRRRSLAMPCWSSHPLHTPLRTSPLEAVSLPWPACVCVSGSSERPPTRQTTHPLVYAYATTLYLCHTATECKQNN